MSGPVAAQEPISPGEVRAQLERMVRSETFRYSERMCSLLRFLVEHALDRRPGPLKEYLIGLKVFSRPETFDPRTDPIVRVEASRLRAKLRDYYLGEGSQDTISIRLPKRGYHPEFILCKPSATHHGHQMERPAPAAAKSGAAIPSVAVLPFIDLSPEATEGYFCDGLTEELINTLARLSGIRVVSRTSVFQLRRSSLEIAQIAEKLGASAIVEGSVRRDGDAVRITAQLVNGSNGYHLWAETYERTLERVFPVQAEIAQAIACALQGELSPRATGSVAVVPAEPRSWDAYHRFLRGLHAWNRRTEEGFYEAIGELRTSLRADPDYAAAWAKLAQSYVGLLLASAADPRSILPEAEEAASKALALGPQLGESWIVSGLLKAIGPHAWNQVEQNFLQALDLAHENPTVHEWHAIGFLFPQGRLEEGVRSLRTAVELDPVSAVTHYHLGLSLHFLGREDEALQELRLAVELEPGLTRGWWDLGRVLAGQGLLESALECFHTAQSLKPKSTFRLGTLGYCQARAGQLDEARALLHTLRQLPPTRYASPCCIAEIHIGLGETEPALVCLREAAQHGVQRLIWVGLDPVYQPLRSDPGFIELCGSLGLAIYER